MVQAASGKEVTASAAGGSGAEVEVADGGVEAGSAARSGRRVAGANAVAGAPVVQSEAAGRTEDGAGGSGAGVAVVDAVTRKTRRKHGRRSLSPVALAVAAQVRR